MIRQLIAAILLWIPTSANAGVFMKSEIGDFADYSSCSAIGQLAGKPVLLACADKGFVRAVSWSDEGWKYDLLETGDMRPTVVAIARLREDKFHRLYVGSHQSKSPHLLELTLWPSGRSSSRKLPFSGKGIIALSPGWYEALNRPGMVVKLFTQHDAPLLGGCGETGRFEMKICYSQATRFRCETVGKSCGSEVGFNPWGVDGSGDVIIDERFWVRHKNSADWEAGKPLIPFRRNIVFSGEHGRVLVDMGEIELTRFNSTVEGKRVELRGIAARKNFEILFAAHSTIKGPSTDEVIGAFRSMAVGRVGLDNEERMYACDSRNVYEFERRPEGWKISQTLRFEGRPDRLHIGDLRGEGFNRLYVVERADFNLTRLFELTRFPSPVVIASMDFDVDLGKDLPEFTDAGAVLGDVYRSMLAEWDHVKLVDPEQIQRVIDERKLQSFLCRKQGCARELGKLLKVQAVFENRLTKTSEGLLLESVFVNVATDKRGPVMRHVGWEKKDVYKALGVVGRHLLSNWPVSEKN